ncbi:MAG: citrate synthase [Tepidisphaeraceae bacterium]|jgi:citrate synthase
MARTAILTFADKKIELPVIEGSEGELGVDVSKLRAQTGLITLDPAYGNTGACTSAITFIDGEKGILRYRGIPIEQLAEKSNFIETAFLLIFGHLPNQEEALRFRRRLTDNAHLHEDFKHHFQGFPIDAPPMAILSAMINTLACFEHKFLKIGDNESFEEAAASLISKVRTIAAYTYRKSRGLSYVYPDPNRAYVSNFLHMMFSRPYQDYHVDEDIEDALNMVLLLHADHEQNCSTSTVRMVGSADASLYSSAAAGVCALWGKLHGGANVEVLEMLEKLHKSGMSIDDFLARVKDKTELLMGFGHRVYKNFDPRAKILKAACDRVLAKVGIKNEPMLDIARRLEEAALKDSYFVDRKLYPNVDFYSGIILKAIGIPLNMFTVMFAIGRMPGWIAQWREQHADKSTRIARPRQIYTGPTLRDYVELDKRV